MRHSWAILHKGVRQERSVLELLPPPWGCPNLSSPKQSFCWPKQVEWMNKGSQNGSLPLYASTYKEALKPTQLSCCRFALVEWKKVDHQLLLHPGCSQARGGSTSAVTHGQRHQKPLQKGWQPSQLSLEMHTSQTAVRPEAMPPQWKPLHPLGSCQGTPRSPAWTRSPLCNCKSRGTPPLWTFLTNYNKSQVPAACSASYSSDNGYGACIEENTASDASKLKKAGSKPTGLTKEKWQKNQLCIL